MGYLDQLINKYKTSINVGLSTSLSQERLIKEGYNVLKKKKSKSIFLVFLNQFLDPTIYLLFASIIVSFLLKEYLDCIVIFLVLIINSLIGTLQEFKAEKALEALKKMSSPHAMCLRDSSLIKIPSFEVVNGDIVYLNEGDIVPCDLFLFECNNLQIDESLLTGESLPVEKKQNDNNLEELNLSLRENEAFMSTKVIKGNGKGICIRRGPSSEIGKISLLINQEEEKTPLQIRLAKLSKFLGIITILLVLILVFFAFFMKYNLAEFFILAISLAVAAIPEGLPMVVTIVLSLNVMKLVKVNALVRNIRCVETLGSVDVVCSDKTGTITENKLKVEKIYFNNQYVEDIHNTILEKAFVYNNNSRNKIGDPLEVCLSEYVINYEELKNKEIRYYELPFSSETKVMEVKVNDGGIISLYTKGAYEQVIKKCKYIYINNNRVVLDSYYKNKLNKVVDEMTLLSLKVIAFSYSIDKEDEQTFLSLVGLIDPPRINIEESIKKLKDASIKVIMITGDHINTAYAIAKKIGLCERKEQCIDLSSVKEIPLNDDKFDDYVVFSRVNPLNKMQIVDYYQKRNHVVLMTGDGVNDSPSLKKADVGISMGLNGSDVCKESSDIILQDDNFKTIELALEEGRNVFINIKKAILFLLSSNLGEVIAIMFFIFLRFPSPLVSLHILWVNLISDSLPALALGSDKKYQDTMKEKPRKRSESLFSNKGMFITLFYGFIIAFISIISFLIVPIRELLAQNLKFNFDNIRLILKNENVLIKARSICFSTLSISEIFHMVGMSNVKANLLTILKNNNNLRILAFFIGLILQIIVIQIPFMNIIFKTCPLELKEWLMVILISFIPLTIHEALVKFFSSSSL